MGVVYRALWNDDRPDLHSAVTGSFKYWVSNVDLEASEPLILDPSEVDVDGAQVGVCQVTLFQERGSLSVNTSTLCLQNGQQILVEADLK